MISSLFIQVVHMWSFINLTHPGKWFGIDPQWVKITQETAAVIQGILANLDFASFQPQWWDANLPTHCSKELGGNPPVKANLSR